MKNIRSIIESEFRQALLDVAIDPIYVMSDGMVLLESGLDSMGFAILVTRLEEELGYDPFVIMDEPVYPKTLGEFVSIYEKYAPKE